MRDLSFYQAHLDRVSRSFAFCIQKLDPPHRQWVSLSYILCRILDTVEDSLWTGPDAEKLRASQYAEFEAFIEKPPEEKTVQAWTKRFPTSIPEGERLLLSDAYSFFSDLHSLPPKVRQSMQETVRRMSAGMKYYSERSKGGELRLTDLVDVNRYCYFVAGIVGELLTKLLLEYKTAFKPDGSFMRNAFHFGLFLQKVNLLKDQRGDEREGRFLVPDRNQLLASLRENAEGALAYLTTIPSEEKGYRTFCAWSFFLGGASLSWIEKSYAADDGTKIPRSVTQELLDAIEAIVQDDQALREGFREYFPELPRLEVNATGPRNEPQWFAGLHGGVLPDSDLKLLRLN